MINALRRRGLWHPGLLLAILDLIGLLIALYLSVTALSGGLPVCGPLKGCEEVALSEYSRVAGIPVAVFGVGLSLTLLVLALAWWRNERVNLFRAHYALSLAGVVFEGYFTYLELFVIEAVCVWCAAYGISLLVRFGVAFAIWYRRL
jgi:uncharacterized membrane protein